MSAFINRLNSNTPIDQLHDSLEVLLAEHKKMESDDKEPSIGENKYLVFLAGLGRKAKNYSYDEVLILEESKWAMAMEAIKVETDQLIEKGVWYESDLPIKTVLVFTKKYDSDGNMVKWKACCIAQDSVKKLDKTMMKCMLLLLAWQLFILDWLSLLHSNLNPIKLTSKVLT
jgi:hypothetical protein